MSVPPTRTSPISWFVNAWAPAQNVVVTLRGRPRALGNSPAKKPSRERGSSERKVFRFILLNRGLLAAPGAKPSASPARNCHTGVSRQWLSSEARGEPPRQLRCHPVECAIKARDQKKLIPSCPRRGGSPRVTARGRLRRWRGGRNSAQFCAGGSPGKVTATLQPSQRASPRASTRCQARRLPYRYPQPFRRAASRRHRGLGWG